MPPTSEATPPRTRPSRRIVAVALLAAAAAALAVTPLASGSGDSQAHVARVIALSEDAHLHLTSKRGFALNEQGSATGTIRGTIYIHLRLVSSSRVTAEVNIYPRGGSLSGHGSAAYRVNGSLATFSGSLSIQRGTGSYARAHAASLRFVGAIQRRTDAVTVQLSGPLTT